MREVAPPGQQVLDDETVGALRDLTQSLIAARTSAAEEHARFLSIAERGLCLPEAELAERVHGATVMVTGGTGCIGSTLISQLLIRRPGRLISVSRGVSDSRPRHASVEYRCADVRERAALDQLIGQVRPCDRTRRICTPPPSALRSGSPPLWLPALTCWSQPAGSRTCWTTRSSTSGCTSGLRAAASSACTARTSRSTSSRRLSPRSCS